MGELIRLLSIMLLSFGGPSTIDVPGIERALRVDDRLLVGSQPTKASFKELAELGVSVVVSVDGMPPQAKHLEEAGIRSVHLPIGYDSVPLERIRSLGRLALEEPGTIYIHCHHGRHRGPAAAAIFWMFREGVSPQKARTLLESAGTSPEYAGLWRSVESFQAPEEDLADAPLPRRVEVDGLVAFMVEIDRARSNLTRHTREQPDIAPRHEARILEEYLREMQRLDPGEHAQRTPGWTNHLAEARAAAEALASLSDSDEAEFEVLLGRLDAACSACHAAHRN